MERQNTILHTLAVISLGMITFEASAQFHTQQTPSGGGARAGRAIVNQQAVTAAQQQGAAMDPNAAMAFSGGDMILTEQQRQAFAKHNPQLRQMQGKVVDVWGRGIHHTDGSFTESKQDTKTKTLEQITKKNNVTLQRRMIMLDQFGRPTEVMIYDGRGTFKYRGVQVYDSFGRFAEEQIYDPSGKLIRRKVQGYTPQGAKMPVRSWDYVDNIPSDLRLVITRENESSTNPVGGANSQQRKPEQEKRGWFNGNNGGNNNATQPAPDTAAAPPQGGDEQQPNYNAAAAVPEKRKGLNLGRLFGKKK
ncbi:MAG: hypothetical protein P1U86_20095 [Verrucomicrobiales bacterium]|nr:hypothetical protein [Verrucomicrobiales bacterium]